LHQYRDNLYAIEVKSGRKNSAKGLGAFCAQFPQALRVIMTPENFAQFTSNPVAFYNKWRCKSHAFLHSKRMNENQILNKNYFL
jgi:hypothetical protein